MTALAAPRIQESKSVKRRVSYKVEDNVKIWSGGLVMINAAGFAQPAAAAASNKGVAGVAESTVDNTIAGHTQGGLEVIVEEGVFRFVAVGAVAGDVGKSLFASDDQTMSSTQAANQPLVGICTRMEAATDVWVSIEFHGGIA